MSNISDHSLITVCIPAYNRAKLLAPLLESIFSQAFDDFDVLICEDGSPEREAIAVVVRRFQQLYPGRIQYEENPANLGYDGNIRRLTELASGRYCLFMGNDDLLCEGALASIAASIAAHPECGVVVRSYASFEGDPAHHKQVFRYFPQEYVLPAGVQAVATAYRRSVVISGMVIHREAAIAVATTRFDGTLLYQLYLVGMILAKRAVVFSPQIVALRRDGTPPDFGNSAVERGKFVPQDQTPESSIHFMQGMLAIAEYIENETKLKVFSTIRSDIGNYSYPIIAIQAQRPLRVFLKYGIDLAKLGFGRSPLFYAYFIAILVFGTSGTDKMIHWLKSHIGHTPQFGKSIKKHKI
jgi:abequosyltransferase